MLGPGPGRFFLVNATEGRVAVNCPGIGAPAAAAQLEVQLFAATIGWLAG